MIVHTATAPLVAISHNFIFTREISPGLSSLFISESLVYLKVLLLEKPSCLTISQYILWTKYHFGKLKVTMALELDSNLFQHQVQFCICTGAFTWKFSIKLKIPLFFYFMIQIMSILLESKVYPASE